MTSLAVRIDPEQNERAALVRIGAQFRDARILEVGCGDGRLTKTLAREARSIVAIDPDPTAAVDFRDADWPSHVDFVPVGLEGLRLADRRFDVVLFSWSL